MVFHMIFLGVSKKKFKLLKFVLKFQRKIGTMQEKKTDHTYQNGSFFLFLNNSADT
jgi:hypothetical protein